MMTTAERPSNDQYPADTTCVTVMTASQPLPPGRTTSDMLSAAPRMMGTDSPGGEHSANTADNCMTSPP
eukprot:1248945-Prymnesium_polylepis.1